MINDILTGNGCGQTFRIGNIAINQPHAQTIETIYMRGLPNQTRHLVAARNQSRGEVLTDKSASASNQYLSHVVQCASANECWDSKQHPAAILYNCDKTALYRRIYSAGITRYLMQNGRSILYFNVH